MDALQVLRDAGLTVELVEGDRLSLAPKAKVTDDLREIARESKTEILTMLRQSQEPPPVPEIANETENTEPPASPYPWPEILGPGPWREIAAPSWAPEDLTGWRRWFAGPNGELRSTTSAQGLENGRQTRNVDAECWKQDPRPDLAGDSALWAQLLALAYDYDGHRAYGLFGALHGLRCMGAGLVVIGGKAKLVHGEMSQMDYDADRTTYLLQHQTALIELLSRLDVAEEKAA
jgi:hypothetical protein